MAMVRKIFYSLVLFGVNVFFLHSNIDFLHPGGRFIVNGGSLNIGSAIDKWNGTLQLVSGSITGNTVGFQEGSIKTTTGLLEVNGLVAPGANPTVTVRGNEKVAASTGATLQTLTVLGTGNILSGQPEFVANATLLNQSSELQINITNRLNKSIAMNNGTLKLLNDLILGDDVTLTGSGIVDLNNRTLKMPAKETTWTSALFFEHANDVVLNAKTTLSGTWTFSGSNAVLQGNGNILDITSGGKLWIKAGSDVEFTDVHIRGLGSGYGSIVFENETSRIRLSNTTLQLASNYSVTQGGIYVEGANSLIVTGTNTLTIAAGASMTVDRITLFADALAATATVNVSPNIPDNQKLIYLNRGVMKATGGGSGDGQLAVDNSNAIVGWIRNTSSAVTGLLVATSVAVSSVRTLANANSTAIVGWIKDTSNSMASGTNALSINNSNAIVTMNAVHGFGIALAQNLADDNSNALVGWVKDTSNALGANRTLTNFNSNAIITMNAVHGFGILLAQNLADDNSNAIVGWVKDTSNAVNAVVGNTLSVNNSNAIVTMNAVHGFGILSAQNLADDNSNALVGWVKDTSNALGANRTLTNYNSNAIITMNAVHGFGILLAQNLADDNSNALVGWVKDTSNALGANRTLTNYNSNAIITMNAVHGFGILLAQNLADDNSNAIVGWVKDTSTAVAGGVFDPVVVEALGTIDHGPAHIHMNTSMTLSYDCFISADHQFKIHTSGVLNGAGHRVKFASGTNAMLEVDAGITVTLENIEIYNYADTKVSLGTGANIIFGQGCQVYIHESQSISRLWKCAGNAMIYGGGNELTIANNTSGIEVNVASNLVIHDVAFAGVKDYRIRCLANESSIALDNVAMILENDYTFSMGSFEFKRDVIWAATMKVHYESAMGSTIASDGRLRFNSGLYWNYNPISANKYGLIFTDSSSQLLLHGNSIECSTTGMQFTRGRILIDDANYLIGSGTTLSEAFIFGTGVTSEEDVNIELLPAAELELVSGVIDYRNIF